MPRMIDLIRASAVPATLMQSAAKGALSIPPSEMIEILVCLSSHKLFGEQARMTLAGWDPRLSLAAASDPKTPAEVLQYLSSPQNIRPALVPALLENPSVSEQALIPLIQSVARDVAETFLASSRVSKSEQLLRALGANPQLSGIQSAAVDDKLASLNSPSLSATSEPVTPLNGPSPSRAEVQVIEVDEDSDEDVTAFLTAHAVEIASEGDKTFQPIGGVHEELISASKEAAPEPATSEPSAGTADVSKPSIPKKPHSGLETERGSALQKISKLDIKGRIQLAMKGTKEERSLLIRDGTKIVALAVLESPKISDGEVEKFAGQKNVLEAVLRAIPLKRRFMKHYGIVRSLVFNPRTPLDISLGLVKNIHTQDLRHLSGNKEVSETIRKLALKMFKQKMDTSKKSTD
jgi:hypothetical protein